VAKEEKTSRAACAFSSLEDHISIEFRAQAVVKVGEVVDAPDFKKTLEMSNHVKGNFDSTFHN
jgi:hypothetical protein